MPKQNGKYAGHQDPDSLIPRVKQGEIGRDWDERFDNHPELDVYQVEYNLPQPTTKQAERIILGGVAREALALFLLRNRDYGDAANELGERAQFVDMNRKFRKLKNILWEGQEPVGESAEEICRDLIGHCLLTIDFLQRRGQHGVLDD